MKLFVCFAMLVLASVSGHAAPVRVITFSTILTELALTIGGDRVEVTGLVKPGVDPHDFQPRPADLLEIASAGLILASGKNMEGFLDKLPASSGSRATLVKVGDRLPSLAAPKEDPHDHAPGDHHSHGATDPHWWHSVENMQLATGIVRDALIQADPAGQEMFTQRAARYLEKLAALRQWQRIKLTELPRNRRRLVTSHDAFQYFARENSFTINAIEGFSTSDEPTSRRVAGIIDTIRREKVKAIFLENSANPKVTTEITRETGARIGGILYADGLAEPDAATFEAMIRHNTSTIVDALK